MFKITKFLVIGKIIYSHFLYSFCLFLLCFNCSYCFCVIGMVMLVQMMCLNCLMIILEKVKSLREFGGTFFLCINLARLVRIKCKDAYAKGILVFCTSSSRASPSPTFFGGRKNQSFSPVNMSQSQFKCSTTCYIMTDDRTEQVVHRVREQILVPLFSAGQEFFCPINICP